MINSITNTQAIIIDELKKLEKELPKKDTDIESKLREASQKKENETQNLNKIEHEAPNYENFAKEIEKYIEGKDVKDIELKFVEIRDSEQLVLSITDKETGEQVRQIPSETSLKIMQHMYEQYGPGIITNEQI
jgi:uncharacterized FlaG/YvyC family protein